jgi:DUF4097 and DUF4098 domain-containing protein YvlB
MPAFATPGPIAATVEVAGAQVRVTASDRTDTVVLVEPINKANRSDVNVASGSGDFDIDRADGSITATTASGAIRIGRMTHGQAKVTNGSGNIEVGISDGTTASMDANSERGSVRNSVASQGSPATSDALVSVHARTRHGDITIQRAAS